MARRDWIYLGIALSGLLPVFLHPGAGVGDGADAFGTWWFYDWLRRCLENGWNPSWTADFFYPLGKDIFAHTGNNFVDAVLSVPFQVVLGDGYQPFFVLFLILGNVACFRPLSREVLGEEGVFPATLLWLCNPYLWFELTAGRPTQAMLWFLPSAAFFLLRLRAAPGWRPALGLGVSVAMAGWTYWFNLYFLLFLLAPLALVNRPSEFRMFLAWIAAAAVLCLLLMLPALAPMMAAAHSGAVPGLAVPEGWFSLPKELANNVSGDLHGLVLMERYGASLYTAPASLLGLGLLAWYRPLRGSGWYFALGLALLFSLGPVLRLDEERLLPLPWYLLLYHKAPFFSRLWFPYRIAGAAFLPFCLLLGGLQRRWVAPLLAGLWLAGLAWQGNWPLRYHSSRPPELLQAVARQGGAMIVLPMRVQHDGLMWQSSLKLPTFGGMGESAPLLWPPGYKEWMADPFIKSLRDACFRPEKAQIPDSQRWQKLGYRWLVLRRDLLLSERARMEPLKATKTEVNAQGRAWAMQTENALVQGLGSPTGQEGAILLWDLKHPFTVGSPTSPEAAADWMEASPEWQERLREIPSE